MFCHLEPQIASQPVEADVVEPDSDLLRPDGISEASELLLDFFPRCSNRRLGPKLFELALRKRHERLLLFFGEEGLHDQ